MSTRVILFDLGGVLVRLGGVDHFGRMVGVQDEEEVWRRWLTSPAVRRFERGECGPAEFAAAMVAEHELDIDAEEFIEVFRSWPKGLLEGAHEMVRGLIDGLPDGLADGPAGSAQAVRVACLSNTNAVHWNEQQDAELVQGLFELAFLSHEIGLVKPDAEIFHFVVAELACDPGEILFFDDNTLNVDAACAAGLDAHKTVGVAPARAILQQRGLLPTSSEAGP